MSCSGTETLPGFPELCVQLRCEFFKRKNPSLGILSIFIMFHHSQQQPDKQPQEMAWKVWRTKINAQTVVRGAELGRASLGWKTSKLLSFKLTLVAREAEMPSPGVRRAWIHEAGEKDSPGPSIPREVQSLCCVKQLLSLSLSASSFLFASQPSPHQDPPKITLENPVLAQLQPPMGRDGEQMWDTVALQ